MHDQYIFDAYQARFANTVPIAMSLNIDLLLVLMMEQEQALVTVDRCRSEITRLLTEQHQRDRSEHATEHPLVEQSTAPKMQRLQSTKETDSSDEELLDKVLLEAARLHELNTSWQPAHSTAPDQQSFPTGTKHKAMQMLAQPGTWSIPGQATHSHPKDHGKPAGLE